MRVGLVAAMPEECAPLLSRVAGFTEESIGRFPGYRFSAGNSEACLIRSGMGGERAAEATRLLVSAFRPEGVISFGFGGGVLPGLTVGDLVVANRLFQIQDGCISEQPGFDAKKDEAAWQFLAPGLPEALGRFHRGTIITTDRIENKRVVARRLPSGVACPILEMETCAVARVTAEAGLPFLALRAVSDDAEEELGFSISEFTDPELNVSISRVLLTLARKPWILPQLVRLARNSRVAGKRLADGVMSVLETL